MAVEVLRNNKDNQNLLKMELAILLTVFSQEKLMIHVKGWRGEARVL